VPWLSLALPRVFAEIGVWIRNHAGVEGPIASFGRLGVLVCAYEKVEACAQLAERHIADFCAWVAKLPRGA
jgi:hypothetical protein